MKNIHFTFAPLFLTCSLLTGSLLADDDNLPDDVDPVIEDSWGGKVTNEQVTGKIADEFDQALSDNLVTGTTSKDVVNGLRQGTAFEYQYINADGDLVTQTIDASTGLGYGEVRHVLTLSEQNGGDLQAVLDMRESGMGWGQIAQQQGTSLGAAKNQPVTTTIISGSGEASNTSGVVSGGGEATRANHGQSKNKNYVSASKGKGVVSGAGYESGALNVSQHKLNGNNSSGAKASHSLSSGAGIVHGGGNAYGLSGDKGNGKAMGKDKH